MNEIRHIESWAKDNNLKLNRQKCVEIVSMDRMSRSLFSPPPVLDRSSRVTSVKILGATVTNKLSVSDHVRHVIASCA